MRTRTPIVQLAVLIVTTIAVAASPALATTIEVPGDFPSISEAIAATEDGDTIRVAPGTYVENIDFSGKAITVTSHYQPGGDRSLVKDTVIDGSGFSSAEAASTVTVKSGEGRDAVLHGFTITGGAGTRWVDPNFTDYTWHGGGGVFIFQSSPTIRHCVITGNQSINDGTMDGAQGGGVLTYGGYPLIHNTIITVNEAEYGGGLVVDYSGAEVLNTLVSNNTVADTYGGGGIWTIGASEDPIDITNCTVTDNVSGSYGGGILVWNSTVSVRNSIFWGNEYGDGFSTIDIAGTAGAIAVTYSNVEGGFAGEGNLNADPVFSDDSVAYLDPSSPCVDAGNPSPEFNDTEDPANAGSARWPAHGLLRNDMGAFGGPGSAGVSNPPPTVVFIPAAASIAGAAGSFFVTDVEINNPETQALSYRFQWLPKDTDNSDPVESDAFDLGPSATARYSNVLSEVLGIEDGAGALALVVEHGIPLVMSRTCNLTDEGTFGQALPGIPSRDLNRRAQRTRVLFMVENEKFRSNLGILNGSPFPVTVVWEMHAADGATLRTRSASLPAFGNTQINRLFGAFAPIEAAYVDVWTTTEGAAVTCYGSVIDNNTNDPTTILPQ